MVEVRVYGEIKTNKKRFMKSLDPSGKVNLTTIRSVNEVLLLRFSMMKTCLTIIFFLQGGGIPTARDRNPIEHNQQFRFRLCKAQKHWKFARSNQNQNSIFTMVHTQCIRNTSVPTSYELGIQEYNSNIPVVWTQTKTLVMNENNSTENHRLFGS